MIENWLCGNFGALSTEKRLRNNKNPIYADSRLWRNNKRDGAVGLYIKDVVKEQEPKT